ncbi:hypothetical protein SynBIOSE41_01689 [Synechococcus sp. BIOS-E4-1]|nr:hypothetical protein SynBIOSE41_01689 [Synechococcus sp. BIOS-E4-1]
MIDGLLVQEADKHRAHVLLWKLTGRYMTSTRTEDSFTVSPVDARTSSTNERISSALQRRSNTTTNADTRNRQN